MAKKLPDLTGKIFGRLTVVCLQRSMKYSNGNYKRYWLCRCSCGNETEVIGSNLGKQTNSCGCLSRELKSSDGRNAYRIKPGAAFRAVYGDYKIQAAKRDIEWCLSEEQFKNLTSLPCYYTGKSPSNMHTAQSGETFVYSGIDRRDNNKGYIFENCVPFCKEVNIMKNALPYDEFIKLCKCIVKRCV